MQMAGCLMADRKVALSAKEIKHMDGEMEVLWPVTLTLGDGLD